jgi:phenylalanyl-tRNA synthetase beta chain
MGALPSDAEVARAAAEEVLLGHGFYEVITDGFYGRPIREKLGLTEAHPLWAHVETANALDRAYSLLKNNTLAQAVELVATNLAVRVDELKAYEWTRTFHPDASAANGTCTERRVLWAVALGSERPRSWAGASRAADALWLKGVVGELARALGVELSLAPLGAEHALAGLLHPRRALAVQQGGVTVGVIGEVHPEVLAGFRIKRGRPVFLELDEAAVLAAPSRPVYREPPTRQPVERDLAFTVPARVEAGHVADALRAAGPDWLTAVTITDRFDHEVDGAPVVTWTFGLTFSAEEADRTTEALNAACAGLVEAVHASLGGIGVRLR